MRCRRTYFLKNKSYICIDICLSTFAFFARLQCIECIIVMKCANDNVQITYLGSDQLDDHYAFLLTNTPTKMCIKSAHYLH